MIELEPVGRMGKPEEIVEAVLWFCSDTAAFVTGHAMSVDGGFIVRLPEMPEHGNASMEFSLFTDKFDQKSQQHYTTCC